MTEVEERNLVDVDLIGAMKGPPLALFAKWRDADPVHWNPPPPAGSYVTHLEGASLDTGFWVLTRYADVASVSRDQKLFSSHEGGPTLWDFEGEALERQRAGIMGMPNAEHLKLKKLIVPAFAPRVIKAFEPEIARVAKEIIDAVAPLGECEFVFDVASRLPVYTFCTILGVPERDRDKIFKLGNAMADVENEATNDADVMAQLFAYADWLSDQKRANPDDSMLSIIVNGEIDGEKMSPPQIQMFFLVMAIAGHETTRNTAAHFIRLMNEHPDQYAQLRSDPDTYLPNAIEEVLRYSPPVIQFRRTATEDTVIGEQPVCKGDKVYLSYAAANRDPAVFPDPDRFDILRANAGRHLSFGVGPHICLGARLAQIQLFLLLKQIVTRIPDIRIAGEMTYLRTIWFHAIMEMPVRFTPER